MVIIIIYGVGWGGFVENQYSSNADVVYHLMYLCMAEGTPYEEDTHRRVPNLVVLKPQK